MCNLLSFQANIIFYVDARFVEKVYIKIGTFCQIYEKNDNFFIFTI